MQNCRQFAICNLQSLQLASIFLYLPAFVHYSRPRHVFAEDQKKVLIPFDFVSKFDDGRYGQMVGDMIWKKVNGEGGFILPESMQDVRDYCQSHHVAALARRSAGKDEEDRQRRFRWPNRHLGKRGAGAGHGRRDLRFDDQVRRFLRRARTQGDLRNQELGPNRPAKSRICTSNKCSTPYITAKAAKQYSVDPVADANWNKNPNLVVGGDFQTGAGGVPKGWESVGGQQREPLGKLVQWVAEDGNPQNKIIRFTFDKAVAEEEGVMYYSDYFPVQEGAKYRFQCRWKTNGPDVKVFIKCYEELNTTYRETPTGRRFGDSRKGSKDRHLPETAQRREVYRSQQNLKGPKNAWNIHTEDFTPTHTEYSPKWGRVMLYAYLRPGVVEFDDVIVKQILPPPKDLNKEPRQSLGTRVTIKEMEENERRSNEAKKKADE